MDKTFEKRKKVVHDLICDDLYTPMKFKELAILLQVAKEDRDACLLYTSAECDREDACTVEFDDNTVKHFSAKTWNRVILAGLKAYGYVNDQKIRSVEMQSCM